MWNQPIRWVALILSVVTGSCFAAGTTITVNTKLDEFNPNQNSVNGPKNQGCSLREAMQVIDSGTNATYLQCASPSGGAPFTIDLTNAGGTIVINSLVKDPSDPTGTNMIRNSTMPDIFAVGAITIKGGDITCDATVPERIFNEAANANLTLDSVTIHDCTVFGQGIAVNNAAGGGQLTLKSTNFTNIHATSSGPGGAVAHSGGTLTLNTVNFLNCSEDNGAGNGTGGALGISSVDSPNTVTLNTVNFTGNTAGDSGGAIYITGADSVTMNGNIFTGNKANGDSSNNSEAGGGAIWAGNTATKGLPTSFFLIFNNQFISNGAPNGTGGAIVLSGGNLTYGNNFQIPGGIVASNFTGNSAGGPAPTGIDPRSGSGGAIYARGNLTIEQSSFVSTIGANSSNHGSGGAIAYYDPSAAFNPMVLANVTINGSTADQNGGAVANLAASGKVMLINDTIDNNPANGNGGTAGGAFFNADSTLGDVIVKNTILADTAGTGGNCSGQSFGSVAADTNLQFPGTTCGVAITSANPLLNNPSIFAGPNLFVFTMSFNAGSAASNTATQSVCDGAPILDFDGTGTPAIRTLDKPCDIGAFESNIAADLTVTKSHTDPFKQGDVADTYTIIVSNSGNDSTSGTVTVTDTLPAGAGLSAISITGGPNWNCVLGTLTCTRSDVLASSASYEPITLTVSVAANAMPAVVDNNATVGGGNEGNTGNDSFNDPTTIVGVITPVRLQSFSVD
jgi:uncharacterized repeat protein (TIGR01451 family)/CSLREA domain-containing protein